jgi:uncharacterized protein (DUF1778 family)
MPKDSSPLCFRVSPEERQLIETVATYHDLTVSEFARDVLLGAATELINDVGPDKVMHTIDEATEARKSALDAERLRAITAAAEPRSRR